MAPSFTHVELPRLRKRVLRLGIAGNQGLRAADIHHAAECGVGFWLWTPRFRSVTPALRALLAEDRRRHVVATLDVAYTGGMVRRGVEKALRTLGTDHLDIYLLMWLGHGSFLTAGIQDALRGLLEEGRIGAAGASIHDGPRAGRLARDSILDALMVRYSARMPEVETDVFPHLAARTPMVVTYTATGWRQLLRPTGGIAMPPWPGNGAGRVPPPLTPGLCYRFCLSSPHVHVVLSAPGSRAELDENLKALHEGALAPDEEKWVREYGRRVRARRRLPYI